MFQYYFINDKIIKKGNKMRFSIIDKPTTNLAKRKVQKRVTLPSIGEIKRLTEEMRKIKPIKSLNIDLVLDQVRFKDVSFTDLKGEKKLVEYKNGKNILLVIDPASGRVLKAQKPFYTKWKSLKNDLKSQLEFIKQNLNKTINESGIEVPIITKRYNPTTETLKNNEHISNLISIMG